MTKIRKPHQQRTSSRRTTAATRPRLWTRVRKTPFWGAICILKTIILPRQAWDRHDESSEQMLLFAGDGGVSGNGAPDPSAYPHYLKMQRALLATGRDIGKKTVVFVSTQLIMMKERIISPRQARDKRRVNSKKRSVFLQSTTSKGCPAGAAARA